jgi:hypothetical protein
MKTKYKIKYDYPNFGLDSQSKHKVTVDNGAFYATKFKCFDNSPGLVPLYKGSRVMSMKNTGNEMIIEREDGDTFELDFAEVMYLHSLLTVYVDQQGCNVSVVKKDSTCK